LDFDQIERLAQQACGTSMIQAPPAQVPFMITQAQKQRLREMGHDEVAIQNMTPEAAHKLLGVLSSAAALKRTRPPTEPNPACHR
jgi:hypothetical protein